MTRRGSADAAVLLWGGYDLRGYTTDYELDKETPVEDVTVLGEADITQQAVGFIGTTIVVNGFYDDAALASHAALVGPANDRVLALALEGNTLGKRFFGAGSAIEFKYVRKVQVGKFHRTMANLVCSGVIDDGAQSLILYPQQTVTAAIAGSTALDGGAATSNGGAAYLQVPALTLGGYTSITTKVQDSADGATGWADIATFTNVAAAPAAQRVAIAGTIRRYTRITLALNGAGSSPSITLFVGLARR